MERSSRTLKLKDFLRRRASSMSSLLLTHLNKMVLWRGKIELYWIWRGPCLMCTRHRIGFGRRRLTPPVTPLTVSISTKSSRKHHMNSSPVKKPNIYYFRVFGSKCFILIKKDRNSKFAPKGVEGFLLGYDSNIRAYRVFNKSTGLVEVSCDIVFDDTNGSQVEQVGLDELDDEEASCITLRNMSIGDVCPKEPEEPSQAQDQPSSSIQASPPTQDEEMAQEEEYEDQDDEPPEEEDIDQGRDEDDQDKEDDQEIQSQRPPHPRVHQAIQRDHPVNSILGDIHKGVTTRSRVAHFFEHYSFVSSIEPYRIEDALRDLNWVVAMQEELNNFTSNEV
jgi:hypothetical protein